MVRVWATRLPAYPPTHLPTYPPTHLPTYPTSPGARDFGVDRADIGDMVSISFLTPTVDERGDYLSALYASIRETLSRFDSPEWNWCVQIDGPNVSETRQRIRDSFNLDSRVDIDGSGTFRPLGPAITRNLALLRATGDILVSIDEDDVLIPETAARLIDIMCANPDFAWAAGGHYSPILPTTVVEGTFPVEGAKEENAVRTLLQLDEIGYREMGEWRRFEPDCQGLVEREGVKESWWQNARFPLASGCLILRRAAVIDAGGWPAMPTAEDGGLLLELSRRCPGYAAAESLLIYRQHAKQVTRGSRHAATVAAAVDFMHLRFGTPPSDTHNREASGPV